MNRCGEPVDALRLSTLRDYGRYTPFDSFVQTQGILPMSLFGFLKKKTTPPQRHEDFFEDMEIVDVIAAQDIPIISLNGNKQRSCADIYFMDYAKLGNPYRINSPIKDIDSIFWIFDTFCVLEVNASDDRAKQFLVLEKSRNSTNELEELAGAQLSLLKMTHIRDMIAEIGETFEMILFRGALIFLQKHQEQAIRIVKHKYYS